MKVGDLIKSKLAPTPRGLVVNVCDDLGVLTIDILSEKGVIIYDQRPDFYEVIEDEDNS